MVERKDLFVYGSLAEGMPHYARISKHILALEPAQIQGQVYRLQVGYPVLMVPGEQTIHGWVATLEGPASFWALLDEFHGHSLTQPQQSLYFRVHCQAELRSGPREVEVYALNPKKLPKTAKLIPDGDWREALASAPALSQRLTERQISYIKRLGSSSGREIVPIDLSLYRELMNLEIIVDKGRRLALSSLGQEVYRFLA